MPGAEDVSELKRRIAEIEQAVSNLTREKMGLEESVERLQQPKPWESFWFRLYKKPLRGMRDHASQGFERATRYALLYFRLISLQYWIISAFPDENPRGRKKRDLAVDVSVVIQLLGVVLLWWFVPEPYLGIAAFFTGYLLFCLYLSLINIVFFSDVPKVNMPTTSATRSLLLLALNVLQVAFTFAIFYRSVLHLCPRLALFGSFLVLGTVGLPDGVPALDAPYVGIQILTNFVLFAFAITVFVSRVPIRLAGGDPEKKMEIPNT
jgi:hypothetical protein